MTLPATQVEDLSFRYTEQLALDDVSFSVEPGTIFGLLGPNGGGKTTLFRILSTLIPVQKGKVTVLGADVAEQPAAVRQLLGVTFQSPSLDGKLSVYENLRHQAHLYGMHGAAMKSRIDELLAEFSLSDRRRDRVDILSGGLKRRVEIAKGLLHHPRLLLLDEPSTGLDPGARYDLWRSLNQLRDQHGVTILVTTHLMEEADRCEQLVILDRGKIVAEGTPNELRDSLGGDCVTIQCDQPAELSASLQQRFGVAPMRLGDSLRLEQQQGHEFVRDVMTEFAEQVRSISLGRPTLEDVFIARTGHRFWEETTE